MAVKLPKVNPILLVAGAGVGFFIVYKVSRGRSGSSSGAGYGAVPGMGAQGASVVPWPVTGSGSAGFALGPQITGAPAGTPGMTGTNSTFNVVEGSAFQNWLGTNAYQGYNVTQGPRGVGNPGFPVSGYPGPTPPTPHGGGRGGAGGRLRPPGKVGRGPSKVNLQGPGPQAVGGGSGMRTLAYFNRGLKAKAPYAHYATGGAGETLGQMGARLGVHPARLAAANPHLALGGHANHGRYRAGGGDLVRIA